MPGVVVEGVIEDVSEVNVTPSKENSVQNIKSPKSTLSPQSPRSIQEEDVPLDEALDTSIEQLYDNVCEMQSSDQSPSRRSYLSDDNESRIDSELRHLVGGEMREVEIMEEEVAEEEEKEEVEGLRILPYLGIQNGVNGERKKVWKKKRNWER